MQHNIHIAAILATGLAAAGLAVQAAAPAPVYVAYVERVYPSSLHLAQVISVTRRGIQVPVADNADLSSGDEIRVLDSQAAVTVRMVATRALFPIRRHGGGRLGEPDFTVPTVSIPGLPGKAWAFIKQAGLSANQARGDTVAASRAVPGVGACFNEGGKTNEPLSFDVPVLTAERSLLAQGQRRLFVSWRGGASPFSAVLSDAVSGQVLARADGVRTHCHAQLPAATIVPGARYRLAIIDGNGVREEDGDLYGAARMPLAPPELQEGAAPGVARALYFATWLSLLGSGEWTFEAEQQVVALSCDAPGGREWLTSIAGSAECLGN